jgi:hypothetical protein
MTLPRRAIPRMEAVERFWIREAPPRRALENESGSR